MKKNFRNFLFFCFACLLLLFACSAKKADKKTETKAVDATKYSTVIMLDKALFEDMKNTDTLSISTKKCGMHTNPNLSVSRPKLKLVLNDGLQTVLKCEKISDNSVFDKELQNLSLKAANQTTVCSVSSKEIEALKKHGLLILGYGAETANVSLSCLDYSAKNGTNIDTSASAKDYFASHYKMGWNLGNYLDTLGSGINSGFSASENWCRAEASPELFKGLKALGFDFVRIPVTYVNHIGNAPDYKINEDFLAYLKKVVDMALAENLGVLINIHHDGSDVNQWLNISKADDNEKNYIEQTVKFCAIWNQVAFAFRDYGSNLAFEGFNEIQDGKWGWGANRSDDGIQYSIVNKWNQAFVAAVRATGGNNVYRYLGLNGYCASPDCLSSLVLPEDCGIDSINRFAVSFHYYSPSDFGIEAKIHKWGTDFGNVPVEETSGNSQEQTLIKTFDRVSALFKDCAVYVGEYGATYQGKTYSDYQRYYLEFLVQYAHKKNMLPVLWDNNAESTGRESFGFIDRKTGKVRAGYEYLRKGIQRASAQEREITEIEKPKMQ
ncbi:MAG: glycoside hydrolase family 5 protein [Treponemataceae bacterium]|nr:glycoside hydrolase family 5 protein [Treponemataceae bacterium]